MFFRKHKPMDEDEFADVIGRLRAERPEPSPLELDEIKMRAMRQANRRGPATTGASMRRTLIVALATGSLMLTGTGAVLADKDGDKSKGNDKEKGDKDKNAGKKQYSHCKKNGASSSSNKSQQQNCPQPPPSGGSHGNGSHQSHKNKNSHGNDDD
jgi:hypothetical protein